MMRVPFRRSKWSLVALVLTVAACSSGEDEDGGDPLRFDLDRVSEQFCAATCRRLVDCADTAPPQSVVDQCATACTMGFTSGSVEVGPDCEPAARTLLDCANSLGCDVDPTTPACVQETASYAQACRPIQTGGGDTCEVGPTRGATESCCPEFGADACGGGLTCAALEGRMIPVCIVERSQAGGEECTADPQCLSEACSLSAGLCLFSSGMTCAPEVGCAREVEFCFALGNEQARCQPSNGREGEPCSSTNACNEGLECADGDGVYDECVFLLPSGAPCQRDVQCSTPLRCRSGVEGSTCRIGAAGEACAGDDECLGGDCDEGVCVGGGVGAMCTDERDCDPTLRCLDDRCGEAQNAGGICDEADDCVAGLGCSSEGRCVDGPVDCVPGASQCPSGSNCQLINFDPFEFGCFPEGSAARNEPCSPPPRCGERLFCLPGAPPTCQVPCQAETDCAPTEQCVPLGLPGGAAVGICLDDA
ncbi:MAG: hypothetical protein AAF851_22005 [Myxococcota bacterium]